MVLTSLNIKPSFTLFHLNLSKTMHVQIPSPSPLRFLNMFSGCTHHTEALGQQPAHASASEDHSRVLAVIWGGGGGFNMSRGHGSQCRGVGGWERCSQLRLFSSAAPDQGSCCLDGTTFFRVFRVLLTGVKTRNLPLHLEIPAGMSVSRSRDECVRTSGGIKRTTGGAEKMSGTERTSGGT